MVPIAAAQGTYNRTKSIMQYAFRGPNSGSIAFRFSATAPRPAAVSAFPTPKSTEKLDTTTSFAEMPAIRDTMICHRPRPAGRISGSNHFPIAAPKLSAGLSTMPDVPKFSTSQIRIDAINMVVPALDR